jgi:peptide/nickel transport system permease protein
MVTESKRLIRPDTATAQTLVPRSRVPAWLIALLKNPVSITGTALVIAFGVVAVFAPLIAPPPIPSEPYQIPRQGFLSEPRPPAQGEPMGTTQGQYDIFYGVVWGTRTAFKIGLIVTSLTFLIGGMVGAVSGYIGGWADEIIQRIVEIFLAFPFLLAALTLATILGAKIQNGLITGMIALVVFGWPGYTRLIRGDILAVKNMDYVMAARVVGVPN